MSDDAHLYERVKELVKGPDLNGDGSISWDEAAGFGQRLVGAAIHVADALNDRQGHFAVLVAECEKLFDEYVPADIAVIPNWIEPTAKAILRSQIREGIERLYDLLDKKAA